VALNFPNNPGIGSVFTDTTAGFSYEWDGTVWKSFAAPSTANIKIIDDISASFNGSTQTFALTSSSVAVSPANAQQLIITLGGVVQDPSDDYSVSGSNITFTTAPASGLTFSAVSLGPAIPITDNVASVYVRQTYVATAGQTTFTFTNGYTSGYLDVYKNGLRLSSGTDFTATNGSTFVLTNAATLNDNIEAIGYQVSQLVPSIGTLTSLNVAGISTLSGATYASNINSTGVITATSFVGSGSNLTGVSGFATALSSTQSSPLSKIFKTPQILDVGAGTSIKVESDATSGNLAFMRENIIHVSTGATLAVGSGTTFIMNVLGLF